MQRARSRVKTRVSSGRSPRVLALDKQRGRETSAANEQIQARAREGSEARCRGEFRGGILYGGCAG